jgi:glutamate/tyrosine decarboxylase-like PLP-dependent enzyme
MTGSSLANFTAMLVARRRALGAAMRRHGVGGARLAAYASAGVHGCIGRAMDFMGLGFDALRKIPTDAGHRIDIAALERRIAGDRAAGIRPFAVIGSAGTVDVGAVDDLAALADIAAREGIWFHVDGALGALAVLAPDLAPRFAGIDRADSLALDFHKLGQVPYDAGFLLVRHPREHFDAFAADAHYLRTSERGLAAGEPWPTSFGPDLSRGFRALKVWMTLKTHGTARLGAVIGELCGIAAGFADRVEQAPGMELMAPTSLNIVCFRHLGPAPDLDALDQEIVFRLHESGVAAPSTTRLGGRLAIRAAFVNHRTTHDDARILLEATQAEAARIIAGAPPAAAA